MSGGAHLAEVLRPYADLLGDRTFIGRHELQAEDGDDWSRWYSDPERAGRRYQSVTWTISSTENAPWSVPWAGTVAAETVVDNWGVIGSLMRAEDGGPKVTVKWLKEEAKRQRELATEVGTWMHDILEAIVIDAKVDDWPDPPPWILGRTLRTGGERILITQETLDSWADGLLAFLTDYRAEVVMAEASIANPVEGYATRIDAGLWLPGHGLVCVDLKSGNVRRSVRAQLAAMLRCTEAWVPGGGKIPMPEFDVAAVLHLRPRFERGYKLTRLLPDEIDLGWREFRAAVRLLQAREAAGELGGSVMYPPEFGPTGEVIDIPKVPMIEDSGLRCRNILRAAGFTWLHELAGFTVTDLLSDPKRKTGIRGVGAAAIEDIRKALAVHGLKLSGELKGAA